MPFSPTPKLPKWIFLVTDLILLVTAWFIASRSSGPLSAAAVYSITACVVAGAFIGTIPLVLHYERRKNEALDDRQRALEALASTITTSAEQIGIAAQGLHEIAEIARKNLQLAEQLPQKLQEKVAGFQAQLASARDEERESLRQELAALRGVESERIAGVADKIQKTAAELAKLEASAQKALASTQAALATAPDALSKASSSALAEIDAKLAARSAAILAAFEAAESRRARRTRADDAEGVPPATPVPQRRRTDPARIAEVGTHIMPIVPPTAAPFAGHIVSLQTAPTPVEPEPAIPAAESIPAPASEPAAVEPTPAVEVPPAAAVPIVPAEAAPVPVPEPAAEAAAAPTAEASLAAASTAPTEEPKPAKKPRAPRKPKPAEPAEAVEPALDLGIPEPTIPVSSTDDINQVPPAEAAERVISSDGATRLLVTAYIGIGNRLFIRGDGPGLSWDKGVPLQFVSIGKWRWETSETTAPVNYKLYKNDETECVALGSRVLDSGHQQEVTATF